MDDRARSRPHFGLFDEYKYAHYATDASGNTIAAKHLGVNTRGTIVRGGDDHLIVTLGLEDCIVVHTPDATLVARKADEESIRQIVKLLEERGWKEYL